MINFIFLNVLGKRDNKLLLVSLIGLYLLPGFIKSVTPVHSASKSAYLNLTIPFSGSGSAIII